MLLFLWFFFKLTKKNYISIVVNNLNSNDTSSISNINYLNNLNNVLNNNNSLIDDTIDFNKKNNNHEFGKGASLVP